ASAPRAKPSSPAPPKPWRPPCAAPSAAWPGPRAPKNAPRWRARWPRRPKTPWWAGRSWTWWNRSSTAPGQRALGEPPPEGSSSNGRGHHVRVRSPPETAHFARAAARATVRFFFLRRLLDRDRRLHAVAAVRAEVLPRGVGNARALVAVGRVRAGLGGRPRLGHRLASRDVAALEVGAVDDDVVRLAPLVGDVDG